MRKTTLSWSVAAVAASLLVPLAQFAAAEGQKGAASGGSVKGGSGGSGGGGRNYDGTKLLFTIPEDGYGDDMFPASSMLVRDIVAARPKEDLVICIAGCMPGRDRVIYAQPFDPLKKSKTAALQQANGLNDTAAHEGSSPDAGDSVEANPDASDKPPAAAAASDANAKAGVKRHAEAAKKTADLPALMRPAFEKIMNEGSSEAAKAKMVPTSGEGPVAKDATPAGSAPDLRLAPNAAKIIETPTQAN